MSQIRAELNLNCQKFLSAIKTVDEAIAHTRNQVVAFAGVFEGLKLAGEGIGEQFEKLKQTLELGAQLNDLKASTGSSVSDLEVLRQAFQNSGLGADGVGPAFAALNKSLSGVNEAGEATKPVFDKLGLSIQALRSMSGMQQLHVLGEALAELPNPADRAKAAMDLFGKAGKKMMALFEDSEGMTIARDQIGDLGATMEANAETFHRISNAVGAMNLKFQQFYAGFAGEIAEKMEHTFGAMAKADFTNAGKTLGMVASNALKLVGYLGKLSPVIAGVTAAMVANTIAARTQNATIGAGSATAFQEYIRQLDITIATTVATEGRMGLMAAAAKGAFASMAAGARGLLAALGPVGIAITAATLGFSYIEEKTNERRNATRTIGDIGAEKMTQGESNIEELKHVTNEDGRTKMAEKLAKQLQEVRKKIADVDDAFSNENGYSDEGRAAIVEEYQNQADAIAMVEKSLNKITPATMAAHAAAQRETQALEEAQKRAQALRDEIAKMKIDLGAEKAKADLDELQPEDRKRKVLSDVGETTTADVEGQVHFLEDIIEMQDKAGKNSDAELTKVKELLEARKQLVEIEKKITEQQKRRQVFDEEQKFALAKAKAEGMPGKQNELADMAAGERRTKYEQAAREVGYSPEEAKQKAAARATAEEDAELRKEAQKRIELERQFSLDIAKTRAEMAGNKPEVSRIEYLQKRDQYIKQAEDAGENPDRARKMGTERANAERDANLAKTKGDKPAVGHLQTIGGGGGPGSSGDPLLRESQKQSRELQRQTVLLSKIANQKGDKPRPSGNLVFE